MKKFFLLCSILLLLTSMNGCMKESDKESKKEQPATKSITTPVITGVTESGIYTSGISINVEEKSGLNYSILLNNEPIENGKTIIENGDYTLKVIVTSSEINTSKEEVVKFKINKDDTAEPGSIMDMIQIAEKIAPEKRQTYINNNFERLKAITTFPITKKDSATFIYKGNQKNVSISGAASIWWGNGTMPMKNIAETDLFYKTIKYESDTRLEYQFAFDNGQSFSDPLNKIKVTSGYDNSEFMMPGYVFRAEENVYNDIPHGTIEEKYIVCSYYDESARKIDNAKRTYSVYLPPGYSTDKKYRVVYFQDGSSYQGEGKVPNILDYMIAHKEIEPVVAVFINYVNGCRRADYIKPTKKYYADFFVNTFIPQIEKDYSVRNDVDGKIFVGESNSGAFILYAATQYPDKMKNLLSNSGAFDWLQTKGLDTTTLKNLNSTNLPIRMFMTVGYYETWISWNKIVYDALKNNKSVIAVKNNRYNMTHNFGLWSDTIRDGLLWLSNPDSKTVIDEKPEQKLRVTIGWRKDSTGRVPTDKKCFIMVRRKDGNSLLESLQNSYSETVACVEVTPNVTDSIEIPIKLTNTAVYGIGMFYDKDMDNTFKSGVDMEIQDSNSDNNKLILDKEESIQPCSIVGVY